MQPIRPVLVHRLLDVTDVQYNNATGDDNANRLRITREQIERLMRGLDDLRNKVLARDPKLFAILAEGPLDDLDRLRHEVNGYIGNFAPLA